MRRFASKKYKYLRIMSFVKFQKANPLLIIYHITVGLSSVFDVNYEPRAR